MVKSIANVKTQMEITVLSIDGALIGVARKAYLNKPGGSGEYK